jgi:hypothetical protein
VGFAATVTECLLQATELGRDAVAVFESNSYM